MGETQEDAAAMDVDSSSNATGIKGASRPPQLLSINVLQLIKSSQAQHGGRYGDYHRYRRFCFARLRRLYKSLKFLHGRGKYMKKSLDASMITEVRFLHIPLFCAERAWSYAMELKQIEGGRHFAQKRSHLVRRLTKAAKWADLFARLCAETADSRTALEAEAYASYMWGSVLMEREVDLERSLAKFVRARTVYEQLGKVGDVEQQLLCRQRVEEIEPNIRFCNYKMGRGNIHSTVELLSLSSAQDVPALDLLHSKLEAVMEEARSQEAANLTELVWVGRKFPLLNAKTRMLILKAQQLEAEVDSTEAFYFMGVERRLSIFDKIFVAYHDAKRQIRDDMVAAGGAEDVKEQLAALDRAVSSIVLQRTIDRNLLLVAGAKQRLERQMRGGGIREGERKKVVVENVNVNVKESKDQREKQAKPEDLVRLYDTLVQNLSDLEDLTTSGREMIEEEISFAAELRAKITTCEAFRCFFVGQSFEAAQKEAEAYVLYDKTLSRINQALKLYSDSDAPKKEEEQDLKDLAEKCKVQQCLMHTRSHVEIVREKEGVKQGLASLNLKEEKPLKKQEDVRFLKQILMEYTPAVAPVGSKAPPRIAQIPPPFEAVPCRPIVIDTALDEITFPNLDARAKKSSSGLGGGLFSSLFGRK